MEEHGSQWKILKFRTGKELDDYFAEFQEETMTAWRTISNNNFNKNVANIIEDSKTKSRIKWCMTTPSGISLPFDGIPFLSAGSKMYQCHRGKNVDARVNEKRNKLLDEREVLNPTIKKKRKLTMTTKKVGCPAIVSALRRIKFPLYKIDFQPAGERSTHQERTISKLLRDDIKDGKKLELVEEYFLKVPNQSVHQFHDVDGEEGDLHEPTDQRIVQRLCAWGRIGVRSVPEIQQHLVNYVQNELFRGQSPPPFSRRRYYPKKKCINHHIRRAKKAAIDDHSNLERICMEWAALHPDDSIFYRAAKKMDGTENKFIFMYQSDWMKQLLVTYGQEMCLIDPTYRSFRYALPFFFLCVRTNVCYIVVAVFITQNEDKESIKEALNLIKILNPVWEPRNLLLDFSLSEMEAVQECFPAARIHVCDFYRRKAWTKWVAKTSHGVSTCKDDVLGSIHEIANSLNEDIMRYNIQKLKESEIWKSSLPLQKYFSNFWELHLQKWVKHYRDAKLQMALASRNGIKQQNSWLESPFLESHKQSNLGDLVEVLLKQLLPNSYEKYKVLNSFDNENCYKQEDDDIWDPAGFSGAESDHEMDNEDCSSSLKQKRSECLKDMKILTDELFSIQDVGNLERVQSLIGNAISVAREGREKELDY